MTSCSPCLRQSLLGSRLSGDGRGAFRQLGCPFARCRHGSGREPSCAGLESRKPSTPRLSSSSLYPPWQKHCSFTSCTDLNLTTAPELVRGGADHHVGPQPDETPAYFGRPGMRHTPGQRWFPTAGAYLTSEGPQSRGMSRVLAA